MNRTIAAILASDVARYSTLIAEDEEETIRRLKSYREASPAGSGMTEASSSFVYRRDRTIRNC